jgi:uncharacterized protein
VFSFILNFVGTVLHFYCAWRVGSLPTVRRRVGLCGWWLAIIVVWVVYVAGVWIGDDPAGLIAWVLSQFAFHWLTTLFLLGLCLLAVEVVTCFGFWKLRRIAVLRLGAVTVGAAMVVIALVQGLRPPVVTHYEVALPDLPAQLDGTTLVAISDLHLGAGIGRDWLAARVEQIHALKPDLVVMVGDLTEGEAGLVPGLEETMRQLRAPLGVWAVTGNHEFHGDTPTTIALFESAGVRWLRDRAVELRPGLSLSGIDYLSEHTQNGSPEAQLLKSLAGSNDGASLLLSHAPFQVEAAADAGFDLMLSGHTHGGQVWPFGYLVRQRYPYFLGHYRVGNMQLLVGRGAGTWGARMRLWQPGEILHIILHSKGVHRSLYQMD